MKFEPLSQKQPTVCENPGFVPLISIQSGEKQEDEKEKNKMTMIDDENEEDDEEEGL